MFTVVHHFIQRDILRSLSRRGARTFGQLRPEGLENGLFGYHLKQLLGNGLVTKEGERYALSLDGLRYVSLATRTNIDILPGPKIFCLLLAENERGQLLMHRRHGAPFGGRYTFPGGSLFYGESLDNLVERQRTEKMGFDVVLEHKGIASLHHAKSGVVISHNYAHLYYGKVTGQIVARVKDERFTPMWIDPLLLTEDQIMPDVAEIVNAIHSSAQFFYLDIRRDD